MRIGRFMLGDRIFCGKIVSGDVFEIEGLPFGSIRETEKRHRLSDLKILAPVDPPNIICIGLNYKTHASESSMEVPARPEIFLKLTTSVIGPGDPVIIPKAAPDEIDYEAELCVVIGRRAKSVGEDEAPDYVLGYTCGNDVSARDCQLKLDRQWARGKSFDTFCPLGPWIETDLDPTALPIRGLLNGNVMQESNTSHMIFPAAQIVSYCSMHFTLLPGTVIMTGTPEGVGFARRPPLFVKAGDVFTVEIGGIGRLESRFVNE